jgi:hypothetical protein
VNRHALLIAPALVFLVVGCRTQSQRYDWGSYDPSLYDYYKNPTKVAELYESLAAIIEEASTNHATVPPGIYAEYGYLQMQQGKNQAAIDLFKQEETRWPESKVFMDRMIKVASAPAAGASPQSSSP